MVTNQISVEEGSGRGLGFLGNLGEFRFKLWLDAHAEEALSEIGVAAGMQVLDYGCGSGKYTMPAAKLVGVTGTVYAQDINKASLLKLRQNAETRGLRNVTTIYWDGGTDIPLDAAQLDVVLLIDVLQEVRDRGALLGDAARVLKSGGVLAVYPMHIDANRVVEAATLAGLTYVGTRVDGHILQFRKK